MRRYIFVPTVFPEYATNKKPLHSRRPAPRGAARGHPEGNGYISTYFVFSGTGANVFALSLAAGAGESVICAKGAHIGEDETGAVEANLGCVVLPVRECTVDAGVDILSFGGMRHTSRTESGGATLSRRSARRENSRQASLPFPASNS